MIYIHSDHAAVRAAAALVATHTRMNAGATPTVLRLYAEVLSLAADPVTPALVDFVLAKPAGTLADGVLTLTLPGDVLILQSGIGVWCRATNGAGAHVFDCNISGMDDEDFDPTAAIILPTRQLRAGGVTRMLSGTLS